MTTQPRLDIHNFFNRFTPQRLRRFAVQGIKFGSVGIVNTLVDAGLYLIFTRWLGLGSLKVLAKAISYTGGVINSYILNRNWTFRSSANVARTFAPFFIANLIGIGVNTGMMQLGLHTLHLSELFAFVFASLFTVGWNFLISKFVVFRH